MNLTSCISRN